MNRTTATKIARCLRWYKTKAFAKIRDRQRAELRIRFSRKRGKAWK